jgi:hypothetical protein
VGQYKLNSGAVLSERYRTGVSPRGDEVVLTSIAEQIALRGESLDDSPFPASR